MTKKRGILGAEAWAELSKELSLKGTLIKTSGQRLYGVSVLPTIQLFRSRETLAISANAR